jgi:hypothetical protein
LRIEYKSFFVCLNNRYNDFQHDELSKCDCTPPYSAILTIAARGDLNVKHCKYPDDELGFWCGGATDAKVRPMFFFLQPIAYFCFYR